MQESSGKKPMQEGDFSFWLPAEDTTISIGPDEPDLDVPQIPIPIRGKFDTDSQPSEKAMGEGIYEYLCLFPDCDHADEYVHILKRAFPFLFDDIASELILLDVKGVDLDGIRRKLALLKILLHLDPDNFGLLFKAGVACYEQALDYAVLHLVENHLHQARMLFERARKINNSDPANLNYLGQVCYLVGSYHQARMYWQLAVKILGDDSAATGITRYLDKISAGTLPDPPLVVSLAQVGEALALFDQGESQDALDRMEMVAQKGSLVTELPNPEFYYLLGLCREKCHNNEGAKVAFGQALLLDQNHQPSREALSRVENQ